MKNISKLKKYSNIITYEIETEEQNYLHIKDSQIQGSGKGLYTMIPIYKDEVISIFKGEILSIEESLFRSEIGQDGYFINMPDGTIMDSNKIECFAKYANDAEGFLKSNLKINSKIALSEKGNVCIVAKRKILAGEEIFCCYGKNYWKKFQNNSK
jgi:hypothetical protein